MQKSNSPALRPIDAFAVVLIVACCAAWGVNQVAIKAATVDIPPILQAGVRSLLSGLLLCAWAQSRGIPLFERDGTLGAGLVIGIVFAIEFLLLFPGLALTTASRGVLFLYAMPIFVALGSHFFVPGDQLTRLKTAGLAASFAGLALALSDGLWGPEAARGSIVGDLMCLASAAGWGVTTLILRTTRLRTVSPEKALLYQLGISAPILIAASLAAGEPPVSLTNASVALAFAYSVVIVAFISYTVWFWLLTRHPASSVAVFTFLTPLFGVLAAYLMLGEPLTPSLIAAMALVAIGIYLVNRPATASTSEA